jgi:hypothetical protein
MFTGVGNGVLVFGGEGGGGLLGDLLPGKAKAQGGNDNDNGKAAKQQQQQVVQVRLMGERRWGAIDKLQAMCL